MRRLLGATDLFSADPPTGPHPHLVGEVYSGFTLAIQGEEVAVFDEESQAVVGLVLSHMVFHIKYPYKRHAAFLAYIERYVLCIDDDTKVPRKVLSFIQNMRK